MEKNVLVSVNISMFILKLLNDMKNLDETCHGHDCLLMSENMQSTMNGSLC